ncbi:MAG: Ig-like domain-containing protein [Candidatus Peregrinibacteria bacterium]
MIKHLIALFIGMGIVFTLGIFGGVAVERFFLATPTTSIQESHKTSPSSEESSPSTPFTVDTNDLSVNYPIRLHLKWQPENAFTEKDVEQYIKLDPPLKGEWTWKKHLLWGGWIAEFNSKDPLPELLTLTINAPALGEPFQRTFEKKKTMAEKNGEMALSCTPPKIVSTTPSNNADNIDPTLPVKIIWNQPVEWEKAFPLLTVTPDLPEKERREMRLESDKSDPSGKTLILSFFPHFPENKKITVSIKKGVPDALTKYPSSEDFSLSFTTTKKK